jgi:23S rRNA pseudouridine1911/1915/1917 synthase
MDGPPFRVLYEDNHLLAIAKRANLPTMGVTAGGASLLTVAKSYIKRKYGKPGEVYLGVVSRLDSLVSGVVVFARTSKAASRLSRQFRTGEIEKTYWAIVERPPRPTAAECVDWLRKDEQRRKMLVARPGAPNAKEAKLSYRTLKRLAGCALVEVRLETGRKHQIRLQLAHRGWPILGDRKYGARLSFPDGIALHAREIRFIHPVRRTPIRLSAPIPDAWLPFGVGETDQRRP